MKYVIELTEEQAKRLGELFDIEVIDDSDVEFAIKMLVEYLSKEVKKNDTRTI